MKLKTKNQRHSIDTISISHYSSLQAVWKIFPNFSSKGLPKFSFRLHKKKNTQLIAPVVSFSSLIPSNFVYSDLKYIKFTLKAHNFPSSRTIDTDFFLKFPFSSRKFSQSSIFPPKNKNPHKLEGVKVIYTERRALRCVLRCMTRWRRRFLFLFFVAGNVLLVPSGCRLVLKISLSGSTLHV